MSFLHETMMISKVVSPIELVGVRFTNTSGSITLPTGMRVGDVVIVGVFSSSDNSLPSNGLPVGYTAIINDATNSPITQTVTNHSIGYKVMTPTVDTTATFTTPAGYLGSCAIALRNVSSTNTLDDVTPTALIQTAPAPTGPAITTVTPGAWVIRIGYYDNDFPVGTPTAPVGHTLLFAEDQNTGLLLNDASLVGAYKLVSTPSTESAATFQNFGSFSDATIGFSFVLRNG